MAGFDQAGGLLPLIVVSALLGLMPLIAMLLTSYMKISIVLYILRNALGIQQAPGNLVLNTVALIISFYLSLPLANEVYSQVRAHGFEVKSLDDVEQIAQRATVPIKRFLIERTSQADREFFVSTTQSVWSRSNMTIEQDSLAALVPAFTLHELTAAFRIGFLIYIPFLAVDLIVANLLMAFGMMMLSPVVISVPFKLLLFVMIDGWNLLIRSLILSYASG